MSVTYFMSVKVDLEKMGFEIVKSDLSRPWGAFYYIEESQAQKFASQFFNKINIEEDLKNFKLSPKILIIKPNKRLSWQYHNRRSEIWQVYKGQIGIMLSTDDTQKKVKICNAGELIKIDQGVRHRIIGLEDFAIVAEIWQHTNDFPSDEDDIVRLKDDFGR